MTSNRNRSTASVARIREQQRLERLAYAGTHSRGEMRSLKIAKRDSVRLLEEVPPDTRDLTARLCGDPLPGRSALDKRKTGIAG